MDTQQIRKLYGQFPVGVLYMRRQQRVHSMD